jgi:hypothetical protein
MRLLSAYHIFLNETSANWFYRAIDDTWVSPENLVEFTGELSAFIDPASDIVIKGSKSRHQIWDCVPWLDGGIGFLLSRAAVRHILLYDFLHVCTTVYMSQDDTATGLIACHTFPDHRYWDSPRFPANPYTSSETEVENWDGVSRKCTGRNIWPIRKAVARHTAGRKVLEDDAIRLNTAPPDLAFEAAPPRVWRVCRGEKGVLKEMTGVEELRRWTPVVKFVEGGQEIPWNERFPEACSQCRGRGHWRENRRMEGWKGLNLLDFSMAASKCPFNSESNLGAITDKSPSMMLACGG